MSIFPGLSIVIVNWNLKDDTLACIDSVFAAGAAPKQVILVDNASEDGSKEAIRARFDPALDILEMETNLGFAGGNNAGIRRALAGKAEWILLLNNDTVIASNMLATLEKATQDFPEYGILAPLIFYYDAPETIWYLGHRLLRGTLITRPIWHEKAIQIGLAPLIEVDFLVGCGVMIRRDVLEHIGLLDETLFMYAEETDFFWRARLAGYRMACVTAAHMWHKVSLSANRDKAKTRYFRVRNQVWFYRKYAHGFQKLTMWIFTLARSLLLSLKDVVSGQPALMVSLWRGWWDGWFKWKP
jgi:GT2 family glycosyltransferase